MSILVVAPELLDSAAADLESIRSALSAAHVAAGGPITGLAAAGADEVSAAVKALFAGFGQEYQTLSAQASVFHQQFAQALIAGAGSYQATEAASTSTLQPVVDDVLGVINAPTEFVLGRPLVGNGANGTVANPNGGAGGLLVGNGGAGYSEYLSGLAGGSGGAAGLIGNGGPGGAGGANANGGAGGNGGFLVGNGGGGGHGGVGGIGGIGGTAGLWGGGGAGGSGGTNSFGGAGGGGGLIYGAAGTAGVGAPVNVTIPLQVVNDTEPVVHISVNGGASVPMLADTGSTGLVIPLRYIGLQHLGLPTGIGYGGYGNQLSFVYLTFDATVNFGNGAVTPPTTVDVPIISWPTTINALIHYPTFASYWAANGVDGVWGVGPNAGGPGHSIPNLALPGDLGQGVLIDEPDGFVQFGPNTGVPVATLSGAPDATLDVRVGSQTAPLIQVSPVRIDSGGLYGTVLSSLVPNGLPVGEDIYYYAPGNPTPLFIQQGTAQGPVVISSGLMNTGFWPFAERPVYIGYSVPGGTITFDAI